MVLGGDGLYKGETGGWEGELVSTPAVLLTGAGKRYDIVACFARHTTVVAADPRRSRPRSTPRTVRRAVPRIDDPGYVPALRGAVRASTTSAPCCR